MTIGSRPGANCLAATAFFCAQESRSSRYRCQSSATSCWGTFACMGRPPGQGMQGSSTSQIRIGVGNRPSQLELAIRSLWLPRLPTAMSAKAAQAQPQRRRDFFSRRGALASKPHSGHISPCEPRMSYQHLGQRKRCERRRRHQSANSAQTSNANPAATLPIAAGQTQPGTSITARSTACLRSSFPSRARSAGSLALFLPRIGYPVVGRPHLAAAHSQPEWMSR